jgi:hypothetical protein
MTDIQVRLVCLTPCERSLIGAAYFPPPARRNATLQGRLFAAADQAVERILLNMPILHPGSEPWDNRRRKR